MVKLFSLNNGADLLLATQVNEDAPVYINFKPDAVATYATPTEDELNEQNKVQFEAEISSRVENAYYYAKQGDGEISLPEMRSVYHLIQSLVRASSWGYE